MKTYIIKIMVPVEGRGWAEASEEVEASSIPAAISKLCLRDKDYHPHNVQSAAIKKEAT